MDQIYLFVEIQNRQQKAQNRIDVDENSNHRRIQFFQCENVQVHRNDGKYNRNHYDQNVKQITFLHRTFVSGKKQWRQQNRPKNDLRSQRKEFIQLIVSFLQNQINSIRKRDDHAVNQIHQMPDGKHQTANNADADGEFLFDR